MSDRTSAGVPQRERTGTDPEQPAAGRGDRTVTFERSPLDVYRVLVYTLAALFVALSTRYLRAGTDAMEEDLTSFLTVEVDVLRNILDGTLVVATFLASLAVLVLPLLLRRWRVFGYVLASNLLAGFAIAAVNAWVGDLDPVSTGVGTDAVALDVSTDVASSTQMVASFVAIAPFVGRRWRLAGIWIVAVVTALRLVAADGYSTHVLLVLSTGAAVGSAVLLAFGRPSTQPSAEGISAALHSGGLEVSTIAPASVDARGSVPWFAELGDGTGIFVKVLGTDQRAADLLFRIYRMVRLRNAGDQRPFSSLRRTVEHEALVALAARDVGVRTPRLRAVSAVGQDSFLLAYDRIAGRSLDSVDSSSITDAVLEAIWEQVAILRTHRIAHRDLRLANVFLAEGTGGEPGAPWLIDFGFSEVAADETLLRTDLAQLLASLAVTVGPARAVASAVGVIGTDELASALGRLQPAALSGATQSALKESPGLLEELREELERTCAVDEPVMEPVTRLRAKQVVSLAAMAAVVYLAAPLLGDLPGIFGDLSGIRWWWVVPLLAASVATYVAAAVSITGSVPQALPPAGTFMAQVASSFATKGGVSGLGGMELNVRFLQRQGLEAAPANAAVGLNAVAGVVGHLSLMLLFVIWSARRSIHVQVPSPWALAVGFATVVAIAAVAMALPVTRRSIRGRLVPLLQRAGAGLRSVSGSPSRLVMLFTGSTLVTFSYGIAFYFAIEAFGIGEGFATTLAVYLVAAAVATLAPTPGGLGAVEAALVAALMAVGVEAALAVPAVFLFRVGTFWLPILPGWAAFRWLRHRELL